MSLPVWGGRASVRPEATSTIYHDVGGMAPGKKMRSRRQGQPAGPQEGATQGRNN